ncbi:MAG: HDOD domain-containing protein [Nitrospirales bacterium]|nr:HDOD domain-containing protein [Nitrospira sp.]MDR4500488.1 HDOD domain-containing protein [Nitrospirales bacterium]
MTQPRHILCSERRTSLEGGGHVPPWILPKELDWTTHQISFDLLGTRHCLDQLDRSDSRMPGQSTYAQAIGGGGCPSPILIRPSSYPVDSLIPAESARDGSERIKGRLIQLLRAIWIVFDYQPATIDQGIIWLGSETVNRLRLIAEIFMLLDKKRDWPLSVDQLWKHSIRTGCFAGCLIKEEGGDAGTILQSCLAGFAHDIGLAILAVSVNTGRYLEVLAHARRESTTLATAELQLLGISHEIVGAELLQRQKFSQPIVHAVSFHDHPLGLENSGVTPTLAVFAANMLDGGGWPQDSDGVPSDRVMEYLSAYGWVNPWPRWRRHVARLDQRIDQWEYGRA